jgi:lycopene cyclase domain-containing protein
LTYNLMNLGFLVPIVVLAIALRKYIWKTGTLWTALLVFTATAIFDNYIIASGVVAYQESATSGVKIGLAPIEDFGYAIAAILGLPAIFEFLGSRRKGAASD